MDKIFRQEQCQFVKVTQLMFGILLAAICSGCGTIASHDDQEVSGGVYHGVYRGVRADWQWIAHPEPETELGVPFYCFDVPFSFVADTFYLPFDTITVMEKSDAKTNIAPEPASTAH